jgi:hypothetical protein
VDFWLHLRLKERGRSIRSELGNSWRCEFTAAALCPFRRDEDRAWFDPEEFLGIVLEHSPTTGSA